VDRIVDPGHGIGSAEQRRESDVCVPLTLSVPIHEFCETKNQPFQSSLEIHNRSFLPGLRARQVAGVSWRAVSQVGLVRKLYYRALRWKALAYQVISQETVFRGRDAQASLPSVTAVGFHVPLISSCSL